MAHAGEFLDTIRMVLIESGIAANFWSAEIPLWVHYFHVEGVDPEFVEARRVTMESWDQGVTLRVTFALEFIAS
jgi:hypothetical protein